MFSLGSASTLFWGLVVAVPVILHLLRKRKTRTVQWGAMRFLQAAIERRAKRFQLWRLLLLMLRIVAVLVLALAVARPLLPSAVDSAAADAGVSLRTLRVIAIDTSYSMRATAADTSRIDRARRAAATLARQAVAGDGFLLVQMAMQPRLIGRGVSMRGDEIASEIESLVVGEGTASLNDTLLVIDRAVEAEADPRRFDRIEYWFFSDLQRSTWAPVVEPNWMRRRQQLSSNQLPPRYVVVDCISTEEPPNVIVSDLDRVDDEGDASIDRFLSQIRLSTAGDSAALPSGEVRQGVLGQLVVDNRIEQSQRVEIDTTSPRTLRWSHRLATGKHVVEVRAGAADAIDVDNIRRSVATAMPPISVAVFGASRRETRFLELAATTGSAGGYEFQHYDFDELPRADLSRANVWILCDPPPLDSAAENRVAAHLGRGGGVVWWLGPAWKTGAGGIEPDPAASVGWLASRIADTLVADGNGSVSGSELVIDPYEYRSPVIAPFKSYPGAGLLTLPVFRYWTIAAGSAWQPVLGVETGAGANDPLILTLDRDNDQWSRIGRQAIVATPPGPGDADQPWNALIAWPAFVPLVQELIGWSGIPAGESTDFRVGEIVSGVAPAADIGSRIRSSSGQVLEIATITPVGPLSRWVAGRPEQAGQLRWADGPKQDQLVGIVNVDPAEGDLSRLVDLPDAWDRFGVDAMASWRPGQPSAGSDATGSLAEEAAATQSQPTGSQDRNATEQRLAGGFAGTPGIEIGWYLLLVALGLLVAESVLVRYLESRF